MEEPIKPVKVKDLIEFLQKQDQELLVCYRCYSEYDLLELKDIDVKELQTYRPGDGWIHTYHGDLPRIKYLAFPGN